jgi:broad specificity phosphatase PhoE
MSTLLLVRHGQASYGEADYDRLSSLGHEQARAVGRFLATAQIDTVYSGPLRRQTQTVALACEAAATIVPELAEYPAFEMLQHFVPRLVAEDPKFVALKAAPTPRLLDEAFKTVLTKWARDEWAVEGVERVATFVERVRSGLDRVLREAGSGSRIVAVTSAGPIGVAVGLVFGIPAERMVRTSIVIRNASITELRFRSAGFDWQPDQLSLVTFNGTRHLPAELTTER